MRANKRFLYVVGCSWSAKGGNPYLNYDGEFNCTDYSIIKKHTVGEIMPEWQKYYADINQDNHIDNNDLSNFKVSGYLIPKSIQKHFEKVPFLEDYLRKYSFYFSKNDSIKEYPEGGFISSGKQNYYGVDVCE